MDVKALRSRLGLNQTEFSACFRLPLRSCQAWEQGFRSPSGGVETYLKMIEADANAVLDILEVVDRTLRPPDEDGAPKDAAA